MTVKAKKPKELLADQELIGFTRQSSGGHQVLRRASSAKVTLEDGVPQFDIGVGIAHNGKPQIVISYSYAGTGDLDLTPTGGVSFMTNDGTSPEEAEELVVQMRKYIPAEFGVVLGSRVPEIRGSGGVAEGQALVFKTKDGTSREEAQQLVDQLNKYIPWYGINWA